MKENLFLEYMGYEELPLIVDWLGRESEEFLIRYAGHTFRFPLTLEQLHTHYEKGLNSTGGGRFSQTTRLPLDAIRKMVLL